jgi:hypothetical protein
VRRTLLTRRSFVPSSPWSAAAFAACRTSRITISWASRSRASFPGTASRPRGGRETRVISTTSAAIAMLTPPKQLDALGDIIEELHLLFVVLVEDLRGTCRRGDAAAGRRSRPPPASGASHRGLGGSSCRRGCESGPSRCQRTPTHRGRSAAGRSSRRLESPCSVDP